MDDPGLDSEQHAAALRGLARLNFLSASVKIVWRPIVRLARELGVKRLRVLDIGTGSGDVPVGLWRKMQKSPLELQLHGVDISEVALDNARQRAKACGADVHFSRFDAATDEIPPGYDVIMCSLLLHHLDDQKALRLLTHMRASAGHLVLVNDLIRGRAGLLLAHLAARLFTRSPVVHVDGPLSVKSSFTLEEIRALAEAAGLQGAELHWRWPFRFLLRWTRS